MAKVIYSICMQKLFGLIRIQMLSKNEKDE